MRAYEATVVLQPGLDDDGVNGAIGQVRDVIAREGGEVESTGQLADRKGNVSQIEEGWKTRKLAYPIGGRREGYYVVVRFQAPPESIRPLENSLQLNEDVLRYLVVRPDA
jgi:small subunit ribosomal protein S6